MSELIPVHPVQVKEVRPRKQAYLPQTVTLRAYEVYCALWGKQQALIEGNCRGGFGLSEVVGLLYAHSFPREEWRQRFEEATKGMEAIP